MGPAALAFVLPGLAFAGSYEEGEAAFHRKHYAAAIEHWRPLAEQGDARAQAGVAALYLNGLGVIADEIKALDWAEKAANRGEPHALYLLGSMYRDGKVVEKDLAKAIAMFGRAADHGFHWAQYALGLMYFVGEGVTLDYAEAYHWLALAAASTEQDDPHVRATAAFLLDQIAAQLTREQLEQAKQRADTWSAVPVRP